MNETLNPRDGVMVYTSPRYDTQEGDRYIRRGDDQWYPGTCEADFFVIRGGLASRNPAPRVMCVRRRPILQRACGFPVVEGRVCDFATTPDVDLLAPAPSSRTCARPVIDVRTARVWARRSVLNVRRTSFVRLVLLMSCLAR